MAFIMTQKFFKPFFILTLSLTAAYFFTGCQNTAQPPATPIATIDAAETKLIEAYLEAIDLVYNTAPEMNENLKYLAIDTSTLINLNELDHSKLLEGLTRYNVEILDCSFEALNEQGYLKDALFENGLFLKIEDTLPANNQIQIIPSKWRSTTYAAGLSKVILTLQDNTWTVTSPGIPWLQ